MGKCTKFITRPILGFKAFVVRLGCTESFNLNSNILVRKFPIYLITDYQGINKAKIIISIYCCRRIKISVKNARRARVKKNIVLSGSKMELGLPERLN